MAPQTVLVLGSTGQIGISAIHGALSNGNNVIAVVRNQQSAQKLKEHISEGHDRITVVEADVISDQGVQGVVDKVRAGVLPPFQHVFSSIGGSYSGDSLLEITTEALRDVMIQNFESNLFAYRATVPYLLEQTDRKTTWTICTGAQGDIGERALPAMSQGALYSFCISAEKALANTNVRFTELYLADRVEVDSSAIQSGVMKASVFGRAYRKILESPGICGRVKVYGEEDVDDLKQGRASDAAGFTPKWKPAAVLDA